VIHAKNVIARQPDEEKVIKGPPANKAFDSTGNPTPVAEGFARKQGIPVSALQATEIDGGQYVTALVKTVGRPTIEVLAEALPTLIAALKFTDTMRWNATQIAFSRPIRWIVALLGEAVIPFQYAGVHADRITRGTRPTGSPEIEVNNATDYLAQIKQRGVILSVAERRQVIWAQVQQLAQTVGGVVIEDPALLEEVANLVEEPTALRGTFERRFLELPRDVLITVMRSKQRYFAVEDGKGGLLPNFITVRNGGTEHLDEVIHGNEHVLTARFSDALFFFNDDRKHTLVDRVPRLKTMTFQEKLGSLYDKNERLRQYVEPLGALLGVAASSSASDSALHTASIAAGIAKADQGTRMVVEMTSLEGVMGREYAKLEGQSAAVAQAIFESYLPRYAGDTLPTSPAGQLLAVADRLDSLVGLFAVDLMIASHQLD
jgi:glycyl-tRNA synthetase